MQTIIRAADAADFLALVPVLAGFRPRRSVALVPFRGSSSLGVMRIDLPPDGEEVERFAATIVGMVCKVDTADAFAIVVYSDEALRDAGGALRHEPLVAALRDRADLCGLGVTDALCVAADGWGTFLRPDQPPRPLSEIEERAAAAAMPARDVEADQASGGELPVADLAAKERTARAVDGLEAALRVLIGARSRPDASPDADAHPTAIADASVPGGPRGREPLSGVDPRALASACALDDLPELFEDALDWPAEPEAHHTAAIIWCLARPSLRDVALTQWCEDLVAGDDALGAQLDWEDGAEYPEHIADRFWGAGPRPNAARLIRALRLVRWAAAVAPRALRPGALAAAAWISWALGRSTHASGYAAQALEIEPEHGLSQIVLTMVSAGHLPEWAFERG